MNVLNTLWGTFFDVDAMRAALPDLLRVGERCDVYVAEESGHLAAYEAGPRLMLVTPV